MKIKYCLNYPNNTARAINLKEKICIFMNLHIYFFIIRFSVHLFIYLFIYPCFVLFLFTSKLFWHTCMFIAICKCIKMIHVRDLIEKSYDVNVSYYFKQTICQIFKNRDHRVEFHFLVFTTTQSMNWRCSTSSVLQGS